MAEQGEQKSGDGGHKRRKRYGGTHPKKFGQKYKERNPGKYPEMQKHLRADWFVEQHIMLLMVIILDMFLMMLKMVINILQ